MWRLGQDHAAGPGMHKRYVVALTNAERTALEQVITAGTALEQVIAAGTAPARKLTHARILLKADAAPAGPGWVDDRIAEAVEVSQPTVAPGAPAVRGAGPGG